MTIMKGATASKTGCPDLGRDVPTMGNRGEWLSRMWTRKSYGINLFMPVDSRGTTFGG
jgi:hypothetical protein